MLVACILTPARIITTLLFSIITIQEQQKFIFQKLFYKRSATVVNFILKLLKFVGMEAELNPSLKDPIYNIASEH